MSPASHPAARVFEDHTAQVYAWAYRLLGRHHDALDVVQDVFLKWLRQCHEQAPDQPRSWLRRVTLHRAIDLVRRRSFEAAPLDESVSSSSAPASGIAASEAAPSSHLDAELLRREVAIALDGLTDVQRAVLVAKVYEELTFAEIAVDLGISPSTAKTHYVRAVRAVRERLSKHWGED